MFALVSITDKVLISYYMPSFRSFGAWVGMVTFTVGIVLILAVPTSRAVSVDYAVVAACAGLIWGLGLALLFLGMRSQEVSRAISIYFIHPIFVALMASLREQWPGSQLPSSESLAEFTTTVAA